MKFVKKVGRSFVEKKAPNGALPTRKLNMPAKFNDQSSGSLSLSFPKFLKEDPKAVISQTIAIIDRAVKKPSGPQTKPNRLTFELRDKLGWACWRLLSNGSFAETDVDGRDKLRRLFFHRIHPYSSHDLWAERKKPKDKGKLKDGPKESLQVTNAIEKRFKIVPGRDYFLVFGDISPKEIQFVEQHGKLILSVSKRAIEKFAGNVIDHLLKQRRRANYQTDQYARYSLADQRAYSISQNTLAKNFVKHIEQPKTCDEWQVTSRIRNTYFGELIWQDNDLDRFNHGGDLAETIFLANENTHEVLLDKDQNQLYCELGNPVLKKNRLSYTEPKKAIDCDEEQVWVIKLINEHYGKVLCPNGNKSMRELRQDKIHGDQNNRLIALYDAIRDFYQDLFTKPFHKDISILLPQNNSDLFHQLDLRTRNAASNNLVRLGRILHYSSADIAEELVISSNLHKRDHPVWTMPKSDLANSFFFSSEGQAHISSTESFVRVWRNSVALAQRTLTGVIDPNESGEFNDNEGRFDVFGGEPLLKALLVDKKPLETASFYERFELLLGTQAHLFNNINPNHLAATLIDYGLAIRHNTFHFKDRKSFSAAFKELDGDFNRLQNLRNRNVELREFSSAYNEVGHQARQLLLDDIKNWDNRIWYMMAGVQLDRFIPRQAFDNFIEFAGLRLSDIQAEFALPKFSKLLTRHANITSQDTHERGKSSKIGGLMDPVSSEKLSKSQALKAKYTAYKVLYEDRFREWISKRNHAEINAFAKVALRRTTDAAQGINGKNLSNEVKQLIMAQASQLPKLVKGESFVHLTAKLSAQTATESRVQDGYHSNSQSAREQSEWINEFKMDLVLQAFDAFCNEEETRSVLESIQSISEESPRKFDALPFSEVDTTPKPEFPSWAARVYLFLHLIPVDQTTLLYQQFLKWGALQQKIASSSENVTVEAISETEKDEVQVLRELFLLYSKMHDDKFSAKIASGESSRYPIRFEYKPFLEFYENEETLKQALGLDQAGQFISTTEDDSEFVTLTRGLRELTRYGDLPFLKRLQAQAIAAGKFSKIRLDDLDYRKPDKLAKVESAQATIASLSQDKKNAKKWSDEKSKQYEDAVKVISNHRAKAACVTMQDFIKTHKILGELFGKFVDKAAMWERDTYFAVLAGIWLFGSDPESALGSNNGIKKSTVTLEGRILKVELKQVLLHLNLLATEQKYAIRNQFSHFNFLRARDSDVGYQTTLTYLISELRKLMGHDRKQKNRIMKSIKDHFTQHGFDAEWQSGSDHRLVFENWAEDKIVENMIGTKQGRLRKNGTFKLVNHNHERLKVRTIKHLKNRKKSNVSEPFQTERVKALILASMAENVYSG